MVKKMSLAVFVISLLSVPSSMHAQIQFYKTGAQMGLMADSLYLGASFIYKDASKPIIVSLYYADAAWTGSLYFMVPGTNTEHYLFKNKDNGLNPTVINLSQQFTIPVGTELFFCYKMSPGQGDPGPKYTGQNRPGIDPYVSPAENPPYGKRWCVAGRIKDPNGFPTDSVELAYEDGGGEDFLDVVFHVRGLGLNIEDPPVPPIDSSVVYDANGDGVGDSLVIIFGQSLLSAVFSRIHLIWPQNTPAQNLNLANLQTTAANAIAVPYIPAATSNMVMTYGTGHVTVTFDSLGNDVQKDADAQDGIGPLLRDTAYIIERYVPGNDTFFVGISENVNVGVINGTSFILVKKDVGTEIPLTLLAPAVGLGGSDSIMFAVGDLGANAPKEGDSLKIHYNGPVVDNPRGNHAHPDNTPVPLTLVRRPVLIDSASYYDNKDTRSDGVVDNIRIFFKKKVGDLQSLELTALWLQDNKKGTVKDLTYDENDSSVVIADIEDIFGSKLQDRTSGAMQLSVKYGTGIDTTLSCDVMDRAAPVISKAVYCPIGYGDTEGFDTLKMKFSEEVNSISSSEPFDLITAGGTKYYLKLKQMGHYIDQAVFEVEEIVDVDYPCEGDSIWIDYQKGISDTVNNKQDIKDNKRVELKVKDRPIEFIVTVIGPVDPTENEINDIFVSQNTTDPITNGTVIVLDPLVEIPDEIMEEVKCRASIYDAVGNILAECNGREDNNDLLQIHLVKINGKNMITILWSGKNMNDRNVGSGSYLCMVYITYPSGQKSSNKVLVAIKK